MSLNSYELSSSYDSGDMHSFSSTNSPWDGQPQPETEDDRSKFTDLFAHNHAQQVLDDYREPFLLPTYRAPPNWRPEYDDRSSEPRLSQQIHDPRYDGSKIQLPIHSPQASNANKSLTHHNNRMAQDLRAILSQPNEVNSLASGTVIYVGPFAALPNLYREQQNIKYYLRSMDGSVRPGGFWSVPNFYITSVRYFLDRNNCRYQIHPDNRSRLKWTLLCAPTENEVEAQKHMVTLGALLLQWCDIFLQSGDFTRLCHALERTEQQISPRMYNQHPTRGPIRPQSRPSVTASSLPVAKVFGDQGPRQREPVRMAFKAAQDFDTLLATRSRAEAMSEFWPGSKILVGAGLRFPRPYEDQQHIHYYHYSFSGEFCWSVPTIYKRYIDQFLQLSHVDYRHIAIGPKYTSYGIASSVKVSKAALFDFGEKLVEWRDLFTETGGLERLIQALHRRDPPPKWNPMFSALNSSPSAANASSMVSQPPSTFDLGPRPPPLPLTYDYQPQQAPQLQHAHQLQTQSQQPQVDLSSHSMHAAFSTGFGMTHPYREYHHDTRALESEDEDRLLREVAALSLVRGLSNESLGPVALARRCSNEADQNAASASAPAQNIN